MYQDIDEFNKLMAQVESNSPAPVNNKASEGSIDFGDYGLSPVQEGILQNGINRVSNYLSAELKSKVSNEWKHLNEDERKTLLRIISGDEGIFDEENENVDVALARAFKNKILLPTKDEDGTPGIIVNSDVDLSNSGANTFPMMSIVKINGTLKCNYSAFSSFANFPFVVKAIEFVKGKGQVETLAGLPVTTGKNETNYAIDLKYTKIKSLRGWKTAKIITGNVSFRACDLEDLTVDGPVYISGILDIRNNPHITIDSLKSILLKDFSKNQIIVKGGIYHTLEADGYYKESKIKNEEFQNEDISNLLEAHKENSNGVLVQQADLWRIGPDIIRQAEAKKAKKVTAKEKVLQSIKPEVEEIVSNIASSQLDKNVVSQSTKKVMGGISSDEFRSLMKGLFDNLLKQIVNMMNNKNGGDSTQVDKSIETISNAAAENVSEKIEEFAKNLETDVKAGNCLDAESIKRDVDALLNSVSAIGSKDITILQTKAQTLESSANDQAEYQIAVKDFLNTLYSGILGKPEISDTLINKIVSSCFGEPQEEPSNQEVIPTNEPEAKPEIVPPNEQPPIEKQAPTLGSPLGEKPTKKAQLKVVQVNKTTPKELRSLDRFAKLMSSAVGNPQKDEQQSEEPEDK